MHGSVAVHKVPKYKKAPLVFLFWCLNAVKEQTELRAKCRWRLRRAAGLSIAQFTCIYSVLCDVIVGVWDGRHIRAGAQC